MLCPVGRRSGLECGGERCNGLVLLCNLTFQRSELLARLLLPFGAICNSICSSTIALTIAATELSPRSKAASRVSRVFASDCLAEHTSSMTAMCIHAIAETMVAAADCMYPRPSRDRERFSSTPQKSKLVKNRGSRSKAGAERGQPHCRTDKPTMGDNVAVEVAKAWLSEVRSVR